MIWFTLGLITSFLMGLALVRLLLGRPSELRGQLLQLTLGWGAGMGVSSVLTFIWFLLFGPLTGEFRLVEVFVCLALLLSATYKNRDASGTGNPSQNASPFSAESPFVAYHRHYFLAGLESVAIYLHGSIRTPWSI